jgi:hypothetical protein
MPIITTFTANFGTFELEYDGDVCYLFQFVSGQIDPEVSEPNDEVRLRRCPPCQWVNLETPGRLYHLYVLIDTTRTYAMMNLVPADGYGTAPSFHTENPDPSINPDQELRFIVSNGQEDRYPARYCYPLRMLREVMRLYHKTGLQTPRQRARYVQWVEE